MEIRRVKGYDGGNHLVSDVIQYRERVGEKWADVEVINTHEAFLRDVEDGLQDLPDYLDDRTRDYYEQELNRRKMLANPPA